MSSLWVGVKPSLGRAQHCDRKAGHHGLSVTEMGGIVVVFVVTVLFQIRAVLLFVTLYLMPDINSDISILLLTTVLDTSHDTYLLREMNGSSVNVFQAQSCFARLRRNCTRCHRR